MDMKPQKNPPTSEEPQRGIVITVKDNPGQSDGLTLRDLVERNLTGILLLLKVQRFNISQLSCSFEFRIPKKIGEADPKPKGVIKLRRVLEY